jgi:hypothetical protein
LVLQEQSDHRRAARQRRLRPAPRRTSESEIFQTPSGKFVAQTKGSPFSQILSSADSPEAELIPISKQTDLLPAFRVPWSHYVRLLAVSNTNARAFYEAEALRGGWSVRQLQRQIDSQFYERTALSKNKAGMLTKGARARPEDVVTPEELPSEAALVAEMDHTRKMLQERRQS